MIYINCSKPLLVSNPSILLALERADLLAPMFALPLEIGVTDFLYERELKDHNGLELQKLGLRIYPLAEKTAAAVHYHAEPSILCRDEIYSLILAQQSAWNLLGVHPELARIAQVQNVPFFWLKEILGLLLEEQVVSERVFYQRLHTMHTSTRCPFTKQNIFTVHQILPRATG